MSSHCCQDMAAAVDYAYPHHQYNPQDCHDKLITFSQVNNQYGLPIHDGGSSYRQISFCPFCGAELAENTLADRALEKQASRDEDRRALEAGEKSAQQLNAENAKFAFPGVVVDIGGAKRSW